MNDRTVTVFGGTGFLGRSVVRHLRKRGFSVRIASRHPDRGHRLFALDDPQLQSVEANIHDEQSVAHALAGSYGVVNAVSLYVEHRQETFHSLSVCDRRALPAESWVLRLPIPHQLNHSGTEGHYGLQCVDVPRSTWGAPSRIKRPTMNHIRFIRLKNFSDRL
jgi:NADH dehydrogenase